jgi:dTDP-glucose 4,6-dehydratase
MKKILITGSAGFIGSHLNDYYLKKKFKVYGVDNLMTGSLENIKHHSKDKNYIFIEHDICNKLKINESIDYILHFASPASPIDYLKYPIETLKIGALGTLNILDLAIEKKATVLVASTSEIYGDPLKHPQNESYYGNVNPIGPRGVYDEAKRYLEAITTAYKNNKKLDVRIVRIFNTYGPRMRVNDGRAIPNFINQCLTNSNITIYGDGLQTRSFCYVKDTIDGISKLLNSNYQYPINVGNPHEYTILELVKIIKSLTSSESKLVFQDLPENDPKMRQPDINNAKKILNWNPKISLKEGLIYTLDYYKNL